MNDLNHVVFRCDATPSTGLGHVIRCVHLAKKLQRKLLRINFVIKMTYNQLLVDQLSDFNVFQIPTDLHWEDELSDAKYTYDVLTAANIYPAAFIVDSYYLNIEWELSVRNLFRDCKIVVIDDFCTRKHDCDLYVNQSLFELTLEHRSLLSKNISADRLAVGIQYALLASNYASVALQSSATRTHKKLNVFIYFGGTDPYQLYDRIYNIFSINRHWNVTLHTVENNFISLETDPSLIIYHPFQDSLAELLLCSDFAIGAGGVSSIERLCCNLWSLTFILANNQMDLVYQLASAGFLDCLGFPDQITDSDIESRINFTIQNLLSIRKKNICNLVDGLGTDRLVDLLLPML